MRVLVVARDEAAPTPLTDCVLLRQDDWNDWWQYRTQYFVTYFDGSGTETEIGQVKIGEFGLRHQEGQEPLRPNLPRDSSELPVTAFSLGQDPSYYESLTALGVTTREQVLRALRDIAYDPDLRVRAEQEDVTGVSLLRNIPVRVLHGQLSRLAKGGVKLTPYEFEVVYRGLRLGFKVTPDSKPPSNIHVLIGRNGVGKSTLLNSIAQYLVNNEGLGDARYSDLNGVFANDRTRSNFSNLVSVSFSAFDDFEPITVHRDRRGFQYYYIGLKKIADNGTLKNSGALSSELSTAARAVMQGPQRARWHRALEILENDPVFAESDLARMARDWDENAVRAILPRIFKRLSSGHKIVLLSITRLVEVVSEKSLVLIDEPESHLHPPLLSAYIRAVSDLLIDRNAVAITATHSPVVLQEVPTSCVWKLARSGNTVAAARPELQTFGENVGTLTNDVFALEVTTTGFHRMLTDVAQQHREYETALDEFEGELGMEGRAILRGRIFSQSTPAGRN